MRPAGLAHQIKRIPADLRHRALSAKLEPVLARDFESQFGAADILHAVPLVEEPDERPDRG